MIIAGVQPLSLIDYPEKPCSIVFTQGCIFRCSYCHNPDLIPLEAIPKKTVEETLAFLSSRKGMIDAVCITGGEPTVHSSLPDFIASLKKAGFFVKLDTNGIRPDVIEKLIASNLVDYFAMDLKAPWQKYLDVIKIGSGATVESCKKTFHLIQNSGVAHEFRTTALPGTHTREDFIEIAEYLNPGEQYFIQRTSYKKTLDPLDPGGDIDMYSIAGEMQKLFPALQIAVR